MPTERFELSHPFGIAPFEDAASTNSSQMGLIMIISHMREAKFPREETKVRGGGLEPPTSSLSEKRSNLLSYPRKPGLHRVTLMEF